jgi:excinuclease ABC subunit C
MEPYVAKSSNLRRRLARLLGEAEPDGKRLNLRHSTRQIEYILTGSDFENRYYLYRTLRERFPADYRERLKLRFPALVRLNLDNPWPRAYTTRKIGSLKGRSIYYGPFASRAEATRFLDDSLDFFKMRRCDFDLDPDPSFPGCVYSEMKMCLAPCFQGCTREAYDQEVNRVQDFLSSAGESLRREMELRREQESEAMHFEAAAAWHERLSKLAPVLQRLPEFVRPVQRWNGVMVQRAAAAKEAVILFRVTGGILCPPAPFVIDTTGSARTQSMEARLTEALAAIPEVPPSSATELMEHLALLRRWLYRGTRKGEIFLEDDRGELPMRRLVRGVSRVFRGEKAEAEAGPPVPPS